MRRLFCPNQASLANGCFTPQSSHKRFQVGEGPGPQATGRVLMTAGDKGHTVVKVVMASGSLLPKSTSIVLRLRQAGQGGVAGTLSGLGTNDGRCKCWVGSRTVPTGLAASHGVMYLAVGRSLHFCLQLRGRQAGGGSLVPIPSTIGRPLVFPLATYHHHHHHGHGKLNCLTGDLEHQISRTRSQAFRDSVEIACDNRPRRRFPSRRSLSHSSGPATRSPHPHSPASLSLVFVVYWVLPL